MSKITKENLKTLLFIIGLISSLYLLINWYVPMLLPWIQTPIFHIPKIFEVLLFLFGSVFLIGIFILIISLAAEKRRPLSANKVMLKDFLKFTLTAEDSIAPNISHDQRQKVIQLVKNQLDSGIVSQSFVVIDEGEESAQICLLLTEKIKDVRQEWSSEICDGNWILKPNKLYKLYQLESNLSAVKIMWD